MGRISKHILGLIGLAAFSCQIAWGALKQDADGYYLIGTADDLAEYRDEVNNGIAMDGRLTADIDMGSLCGVINGHITSWKPINSKRASIKFDGANHTISNLYINSRGNNQGLFFAVDVLENLIVTDAYVKGADNVGGIVSSGYGSAGKCLVNNCHFKGSVIGLENVGGILSGKDMRKANVANCSNSGCVVGGSLVGGICGFAQGAQFFNCYNLGRVKAVSLYGEDGWIYMGIAGGIVGSYDGQQIVNCYNANKISGLATGNITGQFRSSSSDLFSACLALTDCAQVNSSLEMAITLYEADGFKNGKVLKSLNTVVAQEKTLKDELFDYEINLLEWIQSDVAPTFDGVVLTPEETFVVTYRGDYFDNEIFSSNMKLPICSNAAFTYSFADGFDGKSVTCDTVVMVSKELKSDFLELDKDGYYLINDGKDLSLFRDAVNGGATDLKGRLTADIDMLKESANGWSPIGDASLDGDYVFSGVFDGNDFSILNLTVENVSFAGLFARAKNAKIMNVVVKNSTFNGYYAGGICAKAESTTIVNCGNEASVISTYREGVAGFCAVADRCWIANCYNTGEITAQGKASGFIGVELGNSSLVNCYASCVVNKSDTTGLRSPFLFEDLDPNVEECYYDSVLFVSNAYCENSVHVNHLVIASNTEDMKSADFVKALNLGVGELNAEQDTILYKKWYMGETSSYPRFKKDESSSVDDDLIENNFIEGLSVYAIGETLYIWSEKAGVATLFNLSGSAVRVVDYAEGVTVVDGLPMGVYVVEGKKVLLK